MELEDSGDEGEFKGLSDSQIEKKIRLLQQKE